MGNKAIASSAIIKNHDQLRMKLGSLCNKSIMATTVNLISQSSQTIHLLDNHTISGAYHGNYGRARREADLLTLLNEHFHFDFLGIPALD